MVGKLYMAWKREGDDQRIFYNAFDGQNWSHEQLVNGVEGTNAAPSLGARFWA
jgi:hypothetical protein